MARRPVTLQQPWPRPHHPIRQRLGFTLVEVLVALLIMAVLAGLAWQGLDVMVRARDGNDAVLNRTLRLNTVVTQWEQDLQAVQDVLAVPAISFDGQSLRLTRRAEGGVALVVWAVRGSVWQRWVSPTATRVDDLREHWLRSQQLLGNEAGQLNLGEASSWQVYFFRGGAWTNAQSTGDLDLPTQAAVPLAAVTPPPGTPPPGTPPPGPAPIPPAQQPPREQLPAAVRLVIVLGSGTLTRDIALGPGGS